MMKRAAGAVLWLALLGGSLSNVGGIRCFEGNVTYCGINADGGGRGRSPNQYVDGTNWACQDQLSDLDPTTIAPNCWDQESCEALQSSAYDNEFVVSHSFPYAYVGDVKWLVDKGAESADTSAAAYLATAGSNLASYLNLTTGSCPKDHPACGLQTYLTRGTDDTCKGCYRRYRYSADIAATYWNVFQVHKKCIKSNEPDCEDSICVCSTEDPWYKGTCSNWAKAACRRRAYKCMHQVSDYVVATFQDYDIKFCSIGSGDPRCEGCVACTDPACKSPTIPVAQLLRKDVPLHVILANASSYTCDREACGEGARTCWNETCTSGNDCTPQCDPSIYTRNEQGAGLGFYCSRQDDSNTFTDADDKQMMTQPIEQVVCCNDSTPRSKPEDSPDYCNWPNTPAPRGSLPGAGSRTDNSLLLALALSALSTAAASQLTLY